MTVKEIVLLAATELGLGERVGGYLNGGGLEGKEETDRLVECFNLVENQVALDYLPLFAEEEVDTETGAIPFDAFSRRAVRIVRVTDEWGNAVPFKIFPNRIQIAPQRARITYTYTPEQKTVDGEPDWQRAASVRLFAFGVASEYCLMTGHYEESAVWERKFKEAIEAVYRATPPRTIRSRRWA